MQWRTDPNRGLDPETQFVEIYRNLATIEFPWDLNQALSLALFRTYAVPSVGRLQADVAAGARARRPRRRSGEHRAHDEMSGLVSACILM
mgnify:CR=1 FL=1